MNKLALRLPGAAAALLAATLASPAGAQAPTAAVDATQGLPAAKLVAMCIGCHNIPGYQSSFPVVHKVPMIAGQGAKYIAAALTAYKKGDRKHPTMRGVATTLTEQDINTIAAFYEQQGKEAGGEAPPEQPAKQPPADVAALLTKGACVSCHGANFNKPLDPTYPKIAGQYADYLEVSLRAYKAENNAHFGRNNAIMSAQVKQFSPAELKKMAEYIGSLPGELKTVPQSRFRGN
ncbi:c-type cytochrome [Aquabacterium sp. J223]|uniref:c-type cytochrome n=1 Tax=Aquabacterium sp. J223 TaxID=2898431 RepID=UPI0021AD5F42|nr:c-type cytochrome [Aquabacterium sp. J223]UUX96894.1 c-type cytochrome [Aquabacterium sp. J223]